MYCTRLDSRRNVGSSQGAPGRMGQQGDTGLAGYEVNTASLSLHFHHMLTQLDCCSFLTLRNCSHRAIRDPKVQWGPQDQKVKRYTSFISCDTA